jgi:hypothetical protein
MKLIKQFTYLFFVLFNTFLFSQNSFQFKGDISIYKGEEVGIDIEIKKNGQVFKTFHPNESGKYNIDLEYNNIYVVTYSKKGCVSKKVEINTNAPDETLKNNKFKYVWTTDVELFEEFEGIDFSFFAKPIQKIFFDENSGRFDYDNRYAKQIEMELKAKMKEIEERKLAEEKKIEQEKIAAEKEKQRIAAEKLKAEAEAKRLADAKAAQEAKAKLEADTQAKKQEQDKLKAEAEAKRLADAKVAQEAAQEAKAKLEADAQAKKQEQDKLKAEAEAKRLADAKVAQEEKEKKDAELKKQREETAKQKQAELEAEKQKALAEAQLIREEAEKRRIAANEEAERLRQQRKAEEEAKKAEILANTTRTEENSEDASKKTTIITITYGDIVNIYKKVEWNWGGIYYFKNNKNISAAIFNKEAQ